MMKDDPTITAGREARSRISASIDHDPQKLVEYYRRLQEGHSDRLVVPPRQQSGTEDENAA